MIVLSRVVPYKLKNSVPRKWSRGHGIQDHILHSKTDSKAVILEVLLHLHDALREIGWDFGETFTAAVHDVVVAGAAGWTHSNLRDTRPRLRQRWSCPESTHFTVCDGHRDAFNVTYGDGWEGKAIKNIENRGKTGDRQVCCWHSGEGGL